MSKKDKAIRKLTQEVEKWKKLAAQAAEWACLECEWLGANCEKCKIKKIREEAEK